MTGEAQGKLTPDYQASGSMIAALAGMSPYQTPNDCLTRAFNAVDNGGVYSGEREYIEAADWGNKHEGDILQGTMQKLAIDADLEILEPFQHPTLPLAVSLDGIGHGNDMEFTTDPKQNIYVMGRESVVLEGRGILEAKLTAVRPRDEPPPFRGPLQVQAAMMCTGYKWAAIGTLYGGTELRVYIYGIEDAVQSKITADVLDFNSRIKQYRDHGDRDWYPALTPNDAAATWRRVDDGDGPIELSVELSELAQEYDACMKAQAAIAKQKKAITTEIQNYMANHELATVIEDGKQIGTVTWGMSSARKEYTVKAKPAARSSTIKVEMFDDE